MNKKEKKDPFNPYTGILLIGDYEGKSFDQVLKQDPGYLLRMVMYHGAFWRPELRQSFEYWTRVLSEESTDVPVQEQIRRREEYTKNK